MFHFNTLLPQALLVTYYLKDHMGDYDPHTTSLILPSSYMIFGKQHQKLLRVPALSHMFSQAVSSQSLSVSF